MPHYIGTTCGTEFADTAEPPAKGKFVTDERPFFGRQRAAERYIRCLQGRPVAMGTGAIDIGSCTEGNHP
jgi:hypothetical protein